MIFCRQFIFCLFGALQITDNKQTSGDNQHIPLFFSLSEQHIEIYFPLEDGFSIKISSAGYLNLEQNKQFELT